MDIGVVGFVLVYLLTFFLVNPRISYTNSTFKTFAIVAFIVFIVSCAAIDYLGTFFPEYKIQKDTQISRREYLFTVLRSVIMFIVVVIPTAYGFWKLLAWRQTLGWTLSTTHFMGFAVAFVLAGASAEVFSWIIHKLLHKGVLFEYIHSYHHKHIAPVAFSCVDAHPVEVALWDVLPMFSGPVLLGTNANLTMMFVLYAILSTVSAHCGFKYPVSWLDGTSHDLHHEKMKCNYAGNLFMDYMFGTHEDRHNNMYYPQWNRLAKTYDGTYNEPHTRD